MHGYHTLHQWNTWLQQSFLGNCLLEAEKKSLLTLLVNHYGKQALLIGVPNQYDLLSATSINARYLLSPLTFISQSTYIESDLSELPILTGSVDLVVLPHTLEYTHNPRQLLAEACRIIRPEGVICICGFNPYGIWNLCKFLLRNKPIPTQQFIHSYHIRNWLQLVDFKIEKQCSMLFVPPFENVNIYKKLNFVDKVGQRLSLSLGSIYIILARAKVIPLTPIKMKWKQQLNGFRIPTIISQYSQTNL